MNRGAKIAMWTIGATVAVLTIGGVAMAAANGNGNGGGPGGGGGPVPDPDDPGGPPAKPGGGGRVPTAIDAVEAGELQKGVLYIGGRNRDQRVRALVEIDKSDRNGNYVWMTPEQINELFHSEHADQINTADLVLAGWAADGSEIQWMVFPPASLERMNENVETMIDFVGWG